MSWSAVVEMLGCMETTTQQQQCNQWPHHVVIDCNPILGDAFSSEKEKPAAIMPMGRTSSINGCYKRKIANAESSGDYCSKVDKKIKGEEQTASSMKKKNNKSAKDEENYIHVRARRGQATDSHSLAERVRREKISERMKYLQDLVPGCDRITGKAAMLDEIINYAQSLQRQVEFLSMKLATVNPAVSDLNINSFMMTGGDDDQVINLNNQNISICGGDGGSITTTTVSELIDKSSLSYNNPTQQDSLGVNCGVGVPVDLQQHTLQVSDTFTNTIFLDIIPPPYGYQDDHQHQNDHFQGKVSSQEDLRI